MNAARRIADLRREIAALKGAQALPGSAMPNYITRYDRTFGTNQDGSGFAETFATVNFKPNEAAMTVVGWDMILNGWDDGRGGATWNGDNSNNPSMQQWWIDGMGRTGRQHVDQIRLYKLRLAGRAVVADYMHILQ